MTPTEPPADAWPPNTFGLAYTGIQCAGGRHRACPAFWPVRDDPTRRRGTRCSCTCHPWARTDRMLDIKEVVPHAAMNMPLDN